MAELPTGTVTLLFTDVEGSTRLLREQGRDRYDELLADHTRLLRSAFAAHDGKVVDTQGDSFFVAFPTAAAAVAAAVDAQRALAAHQWPEHAAVAVRMGLHTGEPKIGGDRYVGIDVHRAARIGAAGHGGQMLLSSTTKELAENELPPGVTIRHLGERRLKDFDHPQHLYQLDVSGLRRDFGQLRTLDVELRRKRRRLYVGAALIGVAAAAAAIPVFALGQGHGGSVSVSGNAVAVIDPVSNHVVDDIAVGSRPGPIAAGAGSIWVANLDDQSVSRIDPTAGSVSRALPVVDAPTGLAVSSDTVWVVGAMPTRNAVAVRRIDPQFDTVGRPIQVANVGAGSPGTVAALGDRIWVAPSFGLLTRLDPGTDRIVQTIDPNTGPAAVAVAPDAVWVADTDANTVTRVEPSGLVTPITVGNGPSAIAVGAGAVWVVDSLDDAVVRIDPATNAVAATVTVGSTPTGIAFGEDAIWVANSGDGTVSRIDPRSGKTAAIHVGGSPRSLVAAHGRIWVSVDEEPTGGAAAATSGGTARLGAHQPFDYADPALSYYPLPWQVLYATCAKLVNYPDRPAPAGSQLKPEVAKALPRPSANGRTYTFTIRKGFRFSPPSNAPVTAQTFKYTIERTLSPQMKSPAQTYMHDVVGADAYMTGKATHITGVVARGDKLTIRLLRPAPDLAARLSMPFFCAVPNRTPRDPNGVHLIPSAGPYYVTSYVPGQAVVLERNPNYTGSRPHHLDRITLRLDLSQRSVDAQVESGKLDYAAGGLVDIADLARLKTRYGRHGTGAASRPRLSVNPGLGLDMIVLNTHRRLFRDARLRRAVSYAIDRQALAAHGNAYTTLPQQPTDQYLPPGMPGYTNADIYPFTPDVDRARRLAGSGRRTAILYNCNTPLCKQWSQIVTTDLAAIGIETVVKSFPIRELFARIVRKNEPYDLASSGFFVDFADPGTILGHLLGPGGGTAPTFDDPAYRRATEIASRLSGPARYGAYGRLDERTARNDAPWIAIASIPWYDFVSARIGCETFNLYGMDLAALCIRHG